jgi:hypothetical protein
LLLATGLFEVEKIVFKYSQLMPLDLQTVTKRIVFCKYLTPSDRPILISSSLKRSTLESTAEEVLSLADLHSFIDYSSSNTLSTPESFDSLDAVQSLEFDHLPYSSINPIFSESSLQQEKQTTSMTPVEERSAGIPPRSAWPLEEDGHGTFFCGRSSNQLRRPYQSDVEYSQKLVNYQALSEQEENIHRQVIAKDCLSQNRMLSSCF